MKKSRKSTVVIVVLLIALFSYAAFFGFSSFYGAKESVYVKGANDIRWGIDIQGGVEAVFTPDYDQSKVTDEMMDSAEAVITTRLVGQNITDYEVYTDSEEKQIIVRFPWQSDEEDYDPTAAIEELGASAVLTFIEGTEYDKSKIILQGDDVVSATPQIDPETNQYVVALSLSSEGKSKFASATSSLAASQGTISIWMDETMISAPTVQSAITDGNAVITGDFTYDDVTSLANQISSGALPFALTVDNSSLRVISPTLGENSLDSMLLAGIIAFTAVCLVLIVLYRLPGIVSCVALLGQIAGIFACTSGFLSSFDSFTLTIPGITGIILSIGMGVDANVITNERIKEEIRRGRTLDGAVNGGFDSSFWAIFDGNVTTSIVAVILMGVFGPSNGVWSKLLWIFMWLYNHTIGLIPGLSIANTITGSIYSFGYTLLIGVIFNMVMGVWASRAMLKSATRFKFLRKPWLYGGSKASEKSFNFIKSRKIFAIVAAVIIVVGMLCSTVIIGTDLSINFAGGTIVTYSYTGDIAEADVQALAETNLGSSVRVTKTSNVSGEQQLITVELVKNDAVSNESIIKFNEAMEEKYASNTIEVYNSNSVDPTVGKGFFVKCLFAAVLGGLFVTLYVGLRFRKIGGISAAICALLCLVHDVLIAFFCYSIFGFDIDDNFIAVVLTLFGYSLNGTIVIYDRIRENKRLYGRSKTLAEVVNMSVNQTFMRNLITTVETFLAVAIISVVAYMRGIDSIMSFTVPMAIGLLAGCFSSVCLASPMWEAWKSFREKKLLTKKTAK